MRDETTWTTPFPGVKYAACFWGDRYVGTAEDLIAAGLVREDQLPGQSGTNKTRRTFFDGVPLRQGANRTRDERYLAISRSGKKFEVLKGLPEAVERERRAPMNAEMKARVERDQRIAEATLVPASASAYRDAQARWIIAILNSLKQPVVPDSGGFSFALDDEDRDELDDAFERVLDVFRAAAISVDRNKVRELDGLRAHGMARNDASLQQFLNHVKAKVRHG
jgi:hypothetical protein